MDGSISKILFDINHITWDSDMQPGPFKCVGAKSELDDKPRSIVFCEGMRANPTMESQIKLFDYIKLHSTIDKSKFIVGLKGFSLMLQSPVDSQFYPAFSFEPIPKLSYLDISSGSIELTTTQKSKFILQLLAGIAKLDRSVILRPSMIRFDRNINVKIMLTSDIFAEEPVSTWGIDQLPRSNIWIIGLIICQLFFGFSSDTIKSLKEKPNNVLIPHWSKIAVFACACFEANEPCADTALGLLKKFMNEKISFPGTNEEEFLQHKSAVCECLEITNTEQIYDQEFLKRMSTISANPKWKIMYAKSLDDGAANEAKIYSLLSMASVKSNEAVKELAQFVVRHPGVLSQKDTQVVFSELSKSENNDLHLMKCIQYGEYDELIVSVMSADPVAEYNLASYMLQTNKCSDRTLRCMIMLFTDIINNRKVPLFSELWNQALCGLRDIVTMTGGKVDVISRQGRDSSRSVIATELCFGTTAAFHYSNMNDYHAKFQEYNDPLLHYFLGRGAMNSDRDTARMCFNSAMREYKCEASYGIGILHWMEGNMVKAVKHISVCLNYPASPTYQFACEKLSEISRDCLKDKAKSLRFLMMAPKQTNRVKYEMAILSLNDACESMSKQDAEEFINKSDSTLCVIHRYMEHVARREAVSRLSTGFMHTHTPFALNRICNMFSGIGGERNRSMAYGEWKRSGASTSDSNTSALYSIFMAMCAMDFGMETNLTKIAQWKSEMDDDKAKQIHLTGNPYSGYRYREDPRKSDTVCTIIKGVPTQKIPRLVEWIERMTGATFDLSLERAGERNESMREWMLREWRVFGEILMNHIDYGDQEVLDMLN